MHIRNCKPSRYPKSERRHDRGVALITSLLLLMLLTGLSLTMVLAVNSDLLMNGYYRNFRGSFYAADSGLNVVRQDIQNKFMAIIPPTGLPDPMVQPIPTGSESKVLDAIKSYYASSRSISSNSSSPQSFYIDGNKITLTLDPVSGCVAQGSVPTASVLVPTCAQPGTKPTAYFYTYKYHLVSVGQAAGTQKSRIEESGTFTVNVPVQDYTPPSFAGYGMFFDKSDVCGSDLVAGTIYGPVSTNGGFTFGTGKYTFKDVVKAHGSSFGFDFGGNTGCKTSAGAGSMTVGSGKNAVTIAPTFANGFKLGVDQITLPQNSYSQLEAVLDGKGAPACHVDPCPTPVSPTQADMTAKLLNASQKSYAGANGVYMPYEKEPDGSYKFTGGGIYVKGDAQVTLAPVGTTGQQYTIVNNGTTTTIIVDNTANTTTINGTPIQGVPQQLDSNTGAPMGPATMLYVDGNITGLSANQTQDSKTKVWTTNTAVQDGTALTIAAAKDITVNTDIKYKTPPISLTDGSLITGNDKGQALGIFTAGGNINLKCTQSSGNNMEIDASIAPLSQNSNNTLQNTGNAIGTLNIVGGRIQSAIGNINASTRNVYFDKRFAGDFSPPWFPSTSISKAPGAPGAATPTYSRSQWVVQASY